MPQGATIPTETESKTGRQRYFVALKMNRLLRLGELFPKFRFCGNLINASKCRDSRILVIRTYIPSSSGRGLTKLKTRDTIPEDFTLVYTGVMDKVVYGTSITSWVAMILSVGFVCKIVLLDEFVPFPKDSADTIQTGIENYTEFGIVCCIFLGQLILLQTICARYILRMYYNPKTNTYRAIRFGVLPTFTTSHNFQAGTLKKIEKVHLLPWWNVQYKSNNVKMLLFEDGIKRYSDWERMFPK